MSLLYSFAIRCYYAAIWVAAWRNLKARKWIQGRRKINEDTEGIRQQQKPAVWFHCASVGEFEQAYPLIHLIRNDFPKYAIHITFFSPSGYEYAKNKYPEESISYLPLDTTMEVEHFLRRIQPKLIILIKYEFWYNLIQKAHQKSIPILSVSSIFRPNQIFFAWYGGIFRKSLSRITHFFIQNEESALLLNQLKIHQHTVVGDTRFDRVLANSKEPFSNSILETFLNNQPAFIGGSVWNSDIPALQYILQQLPSDWKIILAPHEIGHFDTSWIKEKVCFYTQSPDINAKVIILDIVGLLSKTYRYARLSYVGGGFDKGLHNVLEPIVYGHPVMIGPKFQKFNEAVKLVDLGCIFPINVTIQTPHLSDLIQQNEAFRTEISTKIEAFIGVNTNVSDKIAVFLKRNKLL